MSYPESGTFESGGPCPASHPIRTSQVMFEVIWDTKQFNNKEDWPEDGSTPFVWSFGDGTGYANHADYVFGWKDDSLQRILDTPVSPNQGRRGSERVCANFHLQCYVNCTAVAKMQTIADMNKCSQAKVVDEDIDSCKSRLIGSLREQLSVIGFFVRIFADLFLGLPSLPGGYQVDRGHGSS